jgi:hypothetical protein
MGVGSILVGIAVAIAVGAYVALPFRKAGRGPDKVIEAWVAQVRASGVAPRRAEGRTRRRRGAEPSSDAVNFCPQCGRRAGPDDLFCAGCGRPLRENIE